MPARRRAPEWTRVKLEQYLEGLGGVELTEQARVFKDSLYYPPELGREVHAGAAALVLQRELGWGIRDSCRQVSQVSGLKYRVVSAYCRNFPKAGGAPQLGKVLAELEKAVASLPLPKELREVLLPEAKQYFREFVDAGWELKRKEPSKIATAVLLALSVPPAVLRLAGRHPGESKKTYGDLFRLSYYASCAKRGKFELASWDREVILAKGPLHSQHRGYVNALSSCRMANYDLMGKKQTLGKARVRERQFWMKLDRAREITGRSGYKEVTQRLDELAEWWGAQKAAFQEDVQDIHTEYWRRFFAHSELQQELATRLDAVVMPLVRAGVPLTHSAYAILGAWVNAPREESKRLTRYHVPIAAMEGEIRALEETRSEASDLRRDLVIDFHGYERCPIPRQQSLRLRQYECSLCGNPQYCPLAYDWRLHSTKNRKCWKASYVQVSAKEVRWAKGKVADETAELRDQRESLELALYAYCVAVRVALFS